MPTNFPVSVECGAQVTGRNRLTTLLRPILAIPHAILVGPLYWSSRTGGAGLIGAAAYVLSIVSWFLLLITGQHPKGIREFCEFYLRWRTRALAYMALFVDPYPPFGDGVYPATIAVVDPGASRDRASIAVRLILVIPHLIVLCVLLLAWFVITVIAWFAILFTGSYPQSLLPFALGVMRWTLRVEAYLLLLVENTLRSRWSEAMCHKEHQGHEEPFDVGAQGTPTREVVTPPCGAAVGGRQTAYRVESDSS